MFLGTIPQPVRSILLERAREWSSPAIYVACSGNFTVERTLRKLGRELHSNDVSLYTSAVGTFFARGRKLRIKVREEHREEWGWLGEYVKTPVAAAATVMLCTRMLEGLHRDNPYYRRQRESHVRDWQRLHAATVEKLRKVELRLASYAAADATDWILDAGPNAVVSFPPFYAGGYEALYKGIDAVFEWNAPDYPEMDDERRRLLLERLQDRAEWFFATEFRMEGMDERLVGVVKPSPRSTTFYAYANGEGSRVVMPRQLTEPLPVPHLGPADELGERLSMAAMSARQFAGLRSLFLNPAIAPAAPRRAFAVLCDGKLIGAFAIADGDTIIHRALELTGGLPGPLAYLLSDFPVRPTRYGKLAKLVLMAALSREGQILIERATGRRARSLITTAFTNRPVSMKYRGLFKLVTRKELADGEWTYQLNYGAPLGEWTLEEALARWRDREEQRAAA